MNYWGSTGGDAFLIWNFSFENLSKDVLKVDTAIMGWERHLDADVEWQDNQNWLKFDGLFNNGERSWRRWLAMSVRFRRVFVRCLAEIHQRTQKKNQEIVVFCWLWQRFQAWLGLMALAAGVFFSFPVWWGCCFFSRLVGLLFDKPRLMRGCSDLANHCTVLWTGEEFGCAFILSKVFRGIYEEKGVQTFEGTYNT